MGCRLVSDIDKIPENCDDLKGAVQNTVETDKARQRVLIKKSIELGCVEHIPDSWEVEIHD